jgi:hypothetical protein
MKFIDVPAEALLRWLAIRHTRWFCRLKMLQNHSVQHDNEFWLLYGTLLREGRLVQPMEDCYNLYQFIIQARSLEGDIAELGVYRGGSAKLMGLLKGDKRLHLFDTFEGMPEVRHGLDLHKAGDFSGTQLRSVEDYLRPCKDVLFYQGFFPESAAELSRTATRFALVHLDADIYESTLAGLRFFYPRTVPGGIILCHDYSNVGCPGVKQAVSEFLVGKPERAIPLWKTQCLLIKQ